MQRLEEASRERDSSCGSLKKQQKSSALVLEGSFGRANVLKMMKDAVKRIAYKLEARAVRLTEKNLVNILETVSTDTTCRTSKEDLGVQLQK